MAEEARIFCTDFCSIDRRWGRQVRWDAKLRATPLTDTIGSVPAGTGATARLTIGQEYREWENAEHIPKEFEFIYSSAFAGKQ